jgi:hypothetical protein
MIPRVTVTTAYVQNGLLALAHTHGSWRGKTGHHNLSLRWWLDCVLHARRRLVVLDRRISVHVWSSISATHGGTQSIRTTKRPRLAKETVRAVYCARRGGHCNGLVDLDRSRVALMRRLVVLLALVKLPVALFGFALHIIPLLCGVLQKLRLHDFPLAHFALPVGIRLLRGRNVRLLLLLQCLRYAGQRVWRSLRPLVALRFRRGRSLRGLVGRRMWVLCCHAGQRWEVLVVGTRGV